MNAGDIVELNILSIAFGGAGVAKIDGFVVFVPFCLSDEKVRAKILKVKSNYAEAMPLEVLEQSPKRIKPACRYFGVCGGCVYQHIPYSEQIIIKSSQVGGIYRQFTGKTAQVIQDTCPSPLEYGYRTKIRMKLKISKFRSAMGFFDYYDNRLTDIDMCPIASQKLNFHLKNLRADDFEFFRLKNIRSHNYAFIDTSSGIIDNLGPNIETEIIIQGKKFYYTRESFFQINHSIFDELFLFMRKIFEEYGISNAILLDLYCGVGFFGVALSDIFEKIYFIEENTASYKLLLKNIEANSLGGKTSAFCGSSDRASAALDMNPDVIIMDPPRTGATAESIQKIAFMNPRLVIYISCNPATQIRDLKIFEENGYVMNYLKPFDFFPQTKHIESIAVLNRIEN